MLYGWLLDKNSYRCEPPTDLSYPVVLLQRGESRGDRFIESLSGNLYGVLNVSNISDCNRARSENHVQESSMFSFCSPVRTIAIPRTGPPAECPLPQLVGGSVGFAARRAAFFLRFSSITSWYDGIPR